MQVSVQTEEKLERLPIFLMEQIVKQYRKRATAELDQHQAGINLDQWIVLKLISEHNGTSQVEIAALAVKDAPGTTRIIDQLLRQNLVVKQLDPDDRRRYMLFVTDKGKALIERMLPVVRGYRQDFLRGFTPDERGELISYLQRLQDNLV